MSNHIAVTGTVATAPRLVTHPEKAPWCSFRVAVNNRYYDTETRTWVDGGTDWFNIHTRKALARNAAASLKKGERVVVRGKLRVRNWERDERSGTSVEIEAESVGHDLLWGTSCFTRADRSEGGTGDAGSAGGAVPAGGSVAAGGAGTGSTVGADAAGLAASELAATGLAAADLADADAAAAGLAGTALAGRKAAAVAA